MGEQNGCPGVYAKIARVMQEVETVPKNGRNDFHKYDYVTEADLVNHIRPKMAEIGLVLIASQSEHRLDGEVETKKGSDNIARIWHEFTFVDTEDGSQHSFGVWGEGQDSGDKGSYKAFTGAMKYALMKAFLVATGDDPEQDRHGGQPTRQVRQPKAQSNGTGTPITKETRQQIENLYRPIEELLKPTERKAITDAMTDTEERGRKAIDWLNDRIAALNAPSPV